MNMVPINRSMFIHPRRTPPSAWLGHIPFAGWLVEAVQPSILVELGTHHGASYLAFCQAVQELGIATKCFAVDTWQGDEHSGHYGDNVFLDLLDYHQRNYAEFSRLLRMSFDEAVHYFDDGSIDLLHIDGLHTYEAVKADFETWLPKLSDRAVVVLHDINVRERGFGVWKFWQEVREAYPWFEFVHTHGLGVLIVGRQAQGPVRVLCETSSSDTAININRLFDQLGRLINANVDIGSLAEAQARHLSRIHELERALADRDAVVDSTDSRKGSGSHGAAGRESQLTGLMQQLDGNQQRLIDDLSWVRGETVQVRDNFAEFSAGLKSFADSTERRFEQLLSEAAEMRGLMRELEEQNGVNARHSDELTRLEARLSDQLQQNKSLREQLQDLRDRHDARCADMEAQQKKIDILIGTNDQWRAEAERLLVLSEEVATAAAVRQAELGSAIAKLERVDAELSVMKTSRSWRITAPLRGVAQFFRRKH
jgi:hypothetical protein